jgi:hypothetical protein
MEEKNISRYCTTTNWHFNSRDTLNCTDSLFFAAAAAAAVILSLIGLNSDQRTTHNAQNIAA